VNCGQGVVLVWKGLWSGYVGVKVIVVRVNYGQGVMVWRWLWLGRDGVEVVRVKYGQGVMVCQFCSGSGCGVGQGQICTLLIKIR